MLYRRHTQARTVAASDRLPEGTGTSDGATYADTMAALTPQGHSAASLFDDEPTGAVSERDYSVGELREQAKELGVSTTGTKAELVERINRSLAE